MTYAICMEGEYQHLTKGKVYKIGTIYTNPDGRIFCYVMKDDTKAESVYYYHRFKPLGILAGVLYG